MRRGVLLYVEYGMTHGGEADDLGGICPGEKGDPKGKEQVDGIHTE